MPEVITVKRLGIAVVRLSNPPVNALGRRACYLLTEAVKKAQGDSSEAIILAPAVDVPFSAGADIKEFGGDHHDGANAGSLADLVKTVEESRVPVIAAISGLAYGGGLELALGCHYRLAHPLAKLALPEVKLGILPGCGGTQRLPRLVGMERAVRMIVTGEPISAKEAMAAGLVDEVMDGAANKHGQGLPPQDHIVEAALAFTHMRLKDKRLSVRRTRDLQVPHASSLSPEALTKQAVKDLRVPAPERGGEAQHGCLRAVSACLTGSMEEGLELERTLFLDLLMGSQSQARRYNFTSERRTTRTHPPSERGLVLREVAVVGGGTTGSGIVVAFLDTGVAVTLVERDEASLQRSLASIQAVYASRVRRKKMTPTQAADAESRLGGAVGLEAEELRTVDLVVEAVFEDLQVKQDVFRMLDRVCPPHAILATNTSSLDVDAIAQVTQRPTQVLGMHFFTPTHLMRLVECVKGRDSSQEAIATVTSVAKKMRKVCTVVGNCPGFVGNRMLFPYKAETDFLIEEGASPYAVDKVLYAYGFPMGPFAMSDLAGLDISWKIRKAKGLTDPAKRDGRERYCDVGDRMCEMGRMGQKTSKGWYRYDPETSGRAALPDPEVLAFLDKYRQEKGITPRHDFSDQEILERCLFPLVNEGFKVLEEGIAACPSDIDVIWCSGYSWPVWRGGPMFWALHEVGLPRLLSTIERYHSRFPNVSHWKPAPLLRRLVQQSSSIDLHSRL